MKKIIIIFLLTIQNMCLPAQNNNQVITVEGTELARMQSVTDMIVLLPGVSYVNGEVMVIGRGIPAIFIGTRKITELSELSHINAYRVKEIEVMRHPSAEYEKSVESVIVIRLKDTEAEGLSLNNTLRLDLTHKLSTNEELTLRWRKKQLTLGAFIGWNEERKTYEKYNFTNRYENLVLVSEEKTLLHPDVKKQSLTARFSLAYDFNLNSKLKFNYSHLNNNVNRTWQPETSNLVTHPDYRHDFALEFSSKLGEWSLTLGNNTFFDDMDQSTYKPATSSFYLRDEYDLRTYAKASRALWKGTVMLGAEHELDHMDVEMYENNPETNPLLNVYFSTHAHHPDNTLGIFVNTTQQLGKWNIEAGLRYEYSKSIYRPCDDDGLMHFIDDNRNLIEEFLPQYSNLISDLLDKREVSYTYNRLYPSVRISTKIGKSELSLGHSENSVRPYLGITRLRFSEIEIMNSKILTAEKSSATTLDWQYRWVNIAASHTHYIDPICKTLSVSAQYNAPNYDAMDINVTLSPKIGVWSPMLHATYHKQWFTMPLANGKDKLKSPLYTVTFNNTFTLPHDWIIRLNTQWKSKGAERNDFYYDSDLKLNASVQKDMLNRKLSVILCAVNLLRNSYYDITRYVNKYYQISQGTRERNPRTVSLTIRYRM